MLARVIFWSLLLLTFGYALWRGRSDERIAATVCVLASIATRFAISPLSVRYSSVEIGLLLIDAAVLVAFVAIALCSKRFWPLWVAGLQLTNSLSHLMKVVEIDLIPKAYAAAAMFWSYPILLLIIIGTWRTRRPQGSSDQRNQLSAA
ncbi:MAG TPA: hypothetical protein VMN38_08085 [Sphingomicrobium sp.]|nr:hypothetical protein [Sphingomicrobium sp.]